MRVLHINTTDITGGAGIAAFRLHKALRNAGIDSYMLVQSKKSGDEFVFKSSSFRFMNKLRFELDRFPLRFSLKDKTSIFSISNIPDNLNKIIEKINPDVIHLHWITGGFVRIESIKKFKRPIIWSLHDMWPFTGGCHYDEGCEKFKSDCRNCPFLNEKSTISQKVFNRKKGSYDNTENLNINGLSQWLADCAKESQLFKEKNVYNLPNCIDTSEFFPVAKDEAKKKLSLPKDKRVILFGAVAATKDKRKGFDLFIEAVGKLNKSSETTVLVFGSDSGDQYNIDFKFLGNISDTEQMRLIYSASDLIVVPSRQENLSNVVVEALASGTPVVAFDIGGMPDLIKHKENGWLAKAFDTTHLAEGIEWVLSNPEHEKLQKSANQTVLDKFENSIVVKKYINVYNEILRN